MEDPQRQAAEGSALPDLLSECLRVNRANGTSTELRDRRVDLGHDVARNAVNRQLPAVAGGKNREPG